MEAQEPTVSHYITIFTATWLTLNNLGCINGLEHPDCVEETEEPALEYLPPQDDEPVEEEGGYK